MTSLALETEVVQLRQEVRDLRTLVAEYEAAGVVVIARDEQREAACKALWKLARCNARVLLAMCDRAGRVCSKSALLPYASLAPDDADDKIVDIRVYYVRKALHPKVIETHWGQGYSVSKTVAEAVLRQIKLWGDL